MKYLLKYNEGLFSAQNDNEIVSKIVKTFKSTRPNITSSNDENSTTYNVSNLKLDENPGTYNLTLKINVDNTYELIIQYYKHGVLQITQKLKCDNELYMALYNEILSKYITD